MARPARSSQGGWMMATRGKEFSREHYEEDRLIHEDVQDPDSRGVTEDGKSVLQEECQDKGFRFANRDDSSGCGMRSVGETGQSVPPTYLQRA